MEKHDKQLTEITIKVGRVPAVIFGIIGVALSTLLAFALPIYGNEIIQGIVNGTNDNKILLIIAASLAIAAVTFIILTILIISIVSVWGRFNKGLRIVLFILLVLAILLLIGAAVVGGVWLIGG